MAYRISMKRRDQPTLQVKPAPSISFLDTPQVLIDRVYEALRNAIFSLELEPGQPLVERDLAARFGVSKSPVRDALQRLAGEGLAVQSASRGMSVIRIEPELADEIYSLREVVEEMAVRLATPRLGEDDIAAARAALEESVEARRRNDSARVAACNRRFHDVFIRNCDNRPLAETLLKLQDRVRIISVMGWRSRASMVEEHSQHTAVLEAVAARDARKAGRLMREHIHSSRLGLQVALREAQEDRARGQGWKSSKLTS